MLIVKALLQNTLMIWSVSNKTQFQTELLSFSRVLKILDNSKIIVFWLANWNFSELSSKGVNVMCVFGPAQPKIILFALCGSPSLKKKLYAMQWHWENVTLSLDFNDCLLEIRTSRIVLRDWFCLARLNYEAKGFAT